MPVKDVNLSVGNGPANRNRAVPWLWRGDAMAAGEGGVLRRTVTINQVRAAELRQRARDMGHGQDIASSQKLAHIIKAIELFFDDLMEQAGRQPERGDFMLFDHFAQLGQRRRTRRKN